MKNNVVRKAVSFLAELFFPPRCPFCDRVIALGSISCKECQKKIRYVRGSVCYQCGKPLSKETAEYCRDCLRVKHHYDRGWALYQYESIKNSLYRFKYHDRPGYAAHYAKDMARRMTILHTLSVDCILPVPMYARKERSRGYNQAKELAKYLSKELEIPWNPRLLRRVKKTKPMKELGPSERQLNLRNAFQIRSNDVKLKSILLVDDIYTTGATIDACSLVLKTQGIEKVYFVALAIGDGV